MNPHDPVSSTPEDAARGDIPPAYGQAVAIAVAPDGPHAAVLLATNEEPFVEPYMVVCDKTEDGWRSGIGWAVSGQVGRGLHTRAIRRTSV